MHKRIECIVIGKVQGVFFRDFVKTKADASGLSGFVKNNPDGTVKVVAEGAEEKLKDFLALLKSGTEYSKVENIDVKWHSPTGEFSGFEIKQ